MTWPWAAVICTFIVCVTGMISYVAYVQNAYEATSDDEA